MTRDRSNDPPKTAAELMAELEEDPNFLARARQREDRMAESLARYGVAAEPVVADLRRLGFHVGAIGELSQGGIDYRAAIPVLLRWLPAVALIPLKEDIVRALTVPWAGPVAAPVLIEEFQRASHPGGLGWAIASALEVVADDSVFEEIAAPVQDARYGKAREMLALALGNMQKPAAVPLLIDLLDDPETVGHAAMALGRLGASPARERLQLLVQESMGGSRGRPREPFG